MIPVNALVLYKNKFAIVTEITDGKFVILLQDGSSVKVRDKDIELLHPGPVKKFSEIDVKAADEKAVREAWELFLIECESAQFSLKDLASLIFGGFTPASAIAAYSLLKDGLYFSGALDAIVPRSMDEITAEEAKRDGKQRETGERSAFLERLKKCYKNPAENKMLGEDARFIQDVEALALGRSAKSRAMKELGLGETSEDAHSLLLKTGFWDEKVNPHPSRYGLSLTGANVLPDPPAADDAQTQRRDLCHLVTLAIDNSWSNDPDDAVSIEKDPQGNTVLYVHIADVASSITFDSPAEREARDRGATLYIPEGPVRMLAEEALPVFALGFSEKSQALTFKMTLDKNCVIKSTEIFPSIVKVRRITYEEADLIMESAQPQEEAGVLNALL
ncbi:MAG: RNB domain-containing ribonuclease, partial [Treponema sp.]|nr:RNB domain-containing ribonuclease [Treponema sp.]